MPFVIIKGHYKPLAGRMDGDSVRFLADNKKLWENLQGNKVRLGTGPKTKDTAQLRFEGIDAIEKGATKPLSEDATKSLQDLLGFDKEKNPEPYGYILTRMTDDKYGRPICFAFIGTTEFPDGKKDVYLRAPLLRKSANYKQMEAGYAYPLYYNTLFGEFREVFDEALATAKANNSGYWPKDATEKGITITSKEELKTIAPIWPKLWRRLQEYLGKNSHLAKFIEFLETKNERVDVLSRIMTEKGLQELVKVDGDRVKLIVAPENLRVVAKAGGRKR